MDTNSAKHKAFEDLVTKANKTKNLSTITGTGEENRMFDGIPGKKLLNLESEIGKENCVGNKTPGLKISQPR